MKFFIVFCLILLFSITNAENNQISSENHLELKENLNDKQKESFFGTIKSNHFLFIKNKLFLRF